MLPLDGHVHSEWSWDATNGSMERTCARAVELGLPGLAFTEHADFGEWAVLASDLDEYPHLKAFVENDRPAGDPVGGTLKPAELDVEGYLACIERCRQRFPGLQILSGVELGEPHRDSAAAGDLLSAGRFERVIGSLHSLPDGDGFSELPNLFRQRSAPSVIRDYLAELVRLIEESNAFEILGHIDYAVRYWPDSARRFDVRAFEDDFRQALRALARTGRTLEVNTRGEFPPEVVRWWREEGGKAVAFGSDAHDPRGLARGFAAAEAMVDAV